MTREAELELEIARLREALRKAAYMVRENCITPGGNPFALQEIERLASTQPSTTALQELIEKVERRTIERCALAANKAWFEDPCYIHTITDAIRSLK